MPADSAQSSWGEYARLVLNELERLNKIEEAHALAIAALQQDLVLYKQSQEGRLKLIERRLDRIDDDQNPRSVVSRLRVNEDADTADALFKKWRWAILVFALGLLTSIIIPVVGLVISTRGGG